MLENKIYTGIGARKTPQNIQDLMTIIGFRMAEAGWTLRSGHADGADKAFEKGVDMYVLNSTPNPPMEIYLPWKGFNRASTNPFDHQYVVPQDHCLHNYDEAQKVAATFHPAWHKCSKAAKALHTRNVYQILGKNLDTTSDFVICWTEGGRRQGGTGQALRMAEYYDIPIIDLAIHTSEDLLLLVNEGVLPG